MKKICISLITLAAGLHAVAQDVTYPFNFTVDGINYEVSDDSNRAVIAGFDADLVPETITLSGTVTYNGVEYGGITVPEGTSLYPGMLSKLPARHIVFRNITITPYSFYRNSAVETVSFPETGTDGADPLGGAVSAFSSCMNLTSAIFNPSSGTTALPENFFNGCSSLAGVELPQSLATIGNGAFQNCIRLCELQLPKSLRKINSLAFLNCNRLATVNLPDGIESIGAMAFISSGLEEIVLPASLAEIGEYAFERSSGLKSLVFAEGCTISAIPAGAFSGTALVSVSIPRSVTSIGGSAFLGCEALESIELNEGLLSIGTSAFARCKSIASLSIPSTVADIDLNAFSNCTSLADVQFAPNSSLAVLKDGIFENTDISDIVIPASVTEIGKRAFYNTPIAGLELPQGLKSIGECAFQTEKSMLTGLVIPASVETIGRNAFNGAYPDLRRIIINGSDGDARVAATRIYGEGAFAGAKASLTSVVAYPAEAPVAAAALFDDNVYKTAVLGTLEGAAASYRTQAGWAPFFENNQTTGAGIAVAGGGTPVKVYDINGVLRLVAGDPADVRSLPAGIYIVNGRKTAVR